ncbi:MAG: NAD-dependent epimerase/dehydratase family protein [Deltaproteobacteria bacterium]|nr:NAD-dependent epimerase/dehydratase family protein [Deltaproteobacteria bacterium]
MRILVIGSSGFVGTHLVDRLVRDSHQVRGLDVWAPSGGARFEFQLGSFLDPATIRHALSDVEVVIHLASTTVPGTSNADIPGDIQANLIGTVRLLDAMVEQGSRRIIFFSSGGAVYGNPAVDPTPETQPLYPISSYGVVKAAIEHYLHMYRELEGLESVVLRVSNVYGPGQAKAGIQGLIGTMLRRGLERQPIQIWGDGSVVRDYVYVDDLVEFASLAVCERFGGIFNVGSGVGHSFNSLRPVVESALGLSLKVEFLPPRPFDVRRVVLDVRKAAAVGWQPRVELEEGVRRHARSLVRP